MAIVEKSTNSFWQIEHGSIAWVAIGIVLLLVIASVNPRIGGILLLVVVTSMVFKAHERTDASGHTLI